MNTNTFDATGNFPPVSLTGLPSVPFEEFLKDIRIMEVVGSIPYCYDPIVEGNGPMVFGKERDDGLGKWRRGTESGQLVHRQDDITKLVYEGRICKGYKHPPFTYTTWAAIDVDWHSDGTTSKTAASSSLALCRQADELLRRTGIPPRYICLSSISDANECGGIHIWWIFRKPYPMYIPAFVAAAGWNATREIMLEAGAHVAEITPWEKCQRKLPNAKKLSGYLRLPFSKHHSKSSVSTVVCYGHRLQVTNDVVEEINTMIKRTGSPHHNLGTGMVGGGGGL